MGTAVIVFMAMPVWAGNGKGTGAGTGTGTRTKSQARDGSCRDAVDKEQERQLSSADLLKTLLQQRLRDRDQLRESFCEDGIKQQGTDRFLAGNGLGDFIWQQGRLKDKSCLEEA